MSQSNLAVQPPEEQPQVSQASSGASQPNQAPSNPARKVGAQKTRSPEQQAEIERIGRINPYVGVQRDEDLFTCFNHWSDLKICARVLTIDRLGLSKAIDHYTRQTSKRRGDLLQVPAPVAAIEMEQHGSATNLFLLILEFLCNPLDCGSLRDLRSRTWGTLKVYGVKLLIVNYAELLSFAALNELVRTSEKLGISIVLAGSPYLNDLLDPNGNRKKRYVNVYNTFRKYHQFNLLSVSDTATIIQEWERVGLRWANPLNLTTDSAIVKLLHERSQGQLRPLYENLREIAVWKLEHPGAQINPQNIDIALGNQYQPISKLRQF
ncbi:hypothetical protein C7B76_02320 [filamentous cyanobacterium CCP2]|nr:hypothetical protein C7B76_02320 [filamentous cyanobacterium CCP2]